jgi:hypothetical protein
MIGSGFFVELRGAAKTFQSQLGGKFEALFSPYVTPNFNLL